MVARTAAIHTVLQRRILGHRHLAAAVYQHTEGLGATGATAGPSFITVGHGYQFDFAAAATLSRQPQAGAGSRSRTQAVLHAACAVSAIHRGIKQTANGAAADVDCIKPASFIQGCTCTDCRLGRGTRAIVLEADDLTDIQNPACVISILIGDGQSQINVARAQKGGFIGIRGWVHYSPQLIKGHLAATVDREAKYQLASCGRATFEDRTIHAQLNLLTSGSINQTRVGILYIQAVALGSQTICSRLYVEHTTKVSCCIMIEVGLIDL